MIFKNPSKYKKFVNVRRSPVFITGSAGAGKTYAAQLLNGYDIDKNGELVELAGNGYWVVRWEEVAKLRPRIILGTCTNLNGFLLWAAQFTKPPTILIQSLTHARFVEVMTERSKEPEFGKHFLEMAGYSKSKFKAMNSETLNKWIQVYPSLSIIRVEVDFPRVPVAGRAESIPSSEKESE